MLNGWYDFRVIRGVHYAHNFVSNCSFKFSTGVNIEFYPSFPWWMGHSPQPNMVYLWENHPGSTLFKAQKWILHPKFSKIKHQLLAIWHLVVSYKTFLNWNVPNPLYAYDLKYVHPGKLSNFDNPWLFDNFFCTFLMQECRCMIKPYYKHIFQWIGSRNLKNIIFEE